MSAAGAQQARLQQALRQIATAHGVAVLVTNAVQGSGGGGGASGGGSDSGGGGVDGHRADAVPRAAFGHAWSHTAHTRVLLRPAPPPSEQGSAQPHAHRGAVVLYAHVLKCPHSVREVMTSGGGAAARISFAADGRVASESVTSLTC